MPHHDAYGNVPQLLKSCPEPYLPLHPDNADAPQIGNGDWVVVASPGRGLARMTARVTPDLLPGFAYASFHWAVCGIALVRSTKPPLGSLTPSRGSLR